MANTYSTKIKTVRTEKPRLPAQAYTEFVFINDNHRNVSNTIWKLDYHSAKKLAYQFAMDKETPITVCGVSIINQTGNRGYGIAETTFEIIKYPLIRIAVSGKETKPKF